MACCRAKTCSSMIEPYAKYFPATRAEELKLDYARLSCVYQRYCRRCFWMQEHDGIALSGQSVENFKSIRGMLLLRC